MKTQYYIYEEERLPYEPSHDTEGYKEWALKERLYNDIVELQKDLERIRKEESET